MCHATPALKQHLAQSGPAQRAPAQQPVISKFPPSTSAHSFFSFSCVLSSCSNFGDFQEPYYRNYISTPLAPLFEEAGLKCGMKVRAGAGLLPCCCGSAAVHMMWLSWSSSLPILHS